MATQKKETTKVEKVEEAVVEAVAETQAAAEETTKVGFSIARSVAYAYVGSIVKTLEAAETLYNQVKTDREGLFNDLVNSGEHFMEGYEQKLKSQTTQLMGSLNFKKKAEAEEAAA